MCKSSKQTKKPNPEKREMQLIKRFEKKQTNKKPETRNQNDQQRADKQKFGGMI